MKEVYIPNQEVADEFKNAVENSGWEGISAALRASEKLLEDTVRGDAEAVAKGIDEVIVELKWDKSASGAIDQIKEKRYAGVLDEYQGNLLLVGINYDKNSKKHECVIEKGKCHHESGTK